MDININEKQTEYDVEATYHSDLMCQNYDAKISAVEDADGKVSFFPRIDSPKTKYPFLEWPQDTESFSFIHSDPDRIIAIAEMMKAFAEMVKKNNQKSVDTDIEAC